MFEVREAAKRRMIEAGHVLSVVEEAGMPTVYALDEYGVGYVNGAVAAVPSVEQIAVAVASAMDEMWAGEKFDGSVWAADSHEAVTIAEAISALYRREEEQ